MADVRTNAVSTSRKSSNRRRKSHAVSCCEFPYFYRTGPFSRDHERGHTHRICANIFACDLNVCAICGLRINKSEVNIFWSDGYKYHRSCPETTKGPRQAKIFSKLVLDIISSMNVGMVQPYRQFDQFIAKIDATPNRHSAVLNIMDEIVELIFTMEQNVEKLHERKADDHDFEKVLFAWAVTAFEAIARRFLQKELPFYQENAYDARFLGRVNSYFRDKRIRNNVS